MIFNCSKLKHIYSLKLVKTATIGIPVIYSFSLFFFKKLLQLLLNMFSKF